MMDKYLCVLLCLIILSVFVLGYTLCNAFGLIDLNDEVEDKNNNYYPYNMTKKTTTPQLILPEP